ncbi:MAG: hypothetical protein ABSA30_03420 [Candidatus Aminicenantales bacterium]|jgi:hypothetical protein
MNEPERRQEFRFAEYGTAFDPRPGTIVLDVGRKTVPGVIDHHQADAEPECAASLLAKYPNLVLDHVPSSETGTLTVITHKLPDFDALASIFLALRLIETRTFDAGMAALAAYTKIVDSSSLPRKTELSATPYGILRALFAGARKTEDEINSDRLAEGLRFMRFLHARASEGRPIVEDRRLFLGIDRFERAMHKVDEDHLNYLQDEHRSPVLLLSLPRSDGTGRKRVSGLAVDNPHSFLLKEWARRDRDHAPDSDGFAFVLSRFGSSRYILGVDPAAGVHLRGLGTILNAREAEKRAALGRPAGPPWYEGDCPFFGHRIVDSPQDGSDLSAPEVLSAVVEFGQGRFVRTKE